MAGAWTEKAKRCAELEVLHPDWSNQDLCSEVGIKRIATVSEWRRLPEFQACKEDVRRKLIIKRFDRIMSLAESRAVTMGDTALVAYLGQLAKMATLQRNTVALLWKKG